VGGRFRGTKDIDMVLILNAVQPAFVARFWEFIRDGRYAIAQRADGEKAFYRFQKPESPDYPAMIELLSTAPLKIDPVPGQTIVPIPAGEDVSSLSAILMDQEYFAFILGQRDLVDGLPLIRPAGLIALKARAWLDLSKRRADGDKTVKESDILKHRSDVFRLTAILPAGESLQPPDSIASDLTTFFASFPENSPEWTAIRQSVQSTGIGMSVVELRGVFQSYFSIK
jgi:hypothetical protein